MANPMEFSKGNEDPQVEQIKEIVALAKSTSIGSDELFVAYQLAMGLAVTDLETKQPPREEVLALAKLIEGHMKRGLAANQVVGLIETKRLYDTAAETYAVLVDALQITEKEKRVLKSIVTEKRPGVITIIDSKTNTELHRIIIKKQVEDAQIETNYIALLLMQRLQSYKDKKIEISFAAD